MESLLTNSYRNGNTIVAIRPDGSKYRYTPEGETPAPAFPESIDLKITNQCGEGCPMCHENAMPDGAHGNLNHPILDSLPAHTELAIGGGNPLLHPDLLGFLQRMKRQEVICNITVHWNQLKQNSDLLRGWQRDGLIHGIGVSVNQRVEDTGLLRSFPHLVVHTIAGVADEEIYASLADNYLNLLILGYKDYGRGIAYHSGNEDVERKIRWTGDHLVDLVDHFSSICFDDLSVRQLRLKDRMTDEAWEQFYMGGDGEFTMYVDLVEDVFAASSVSERQPIDSADIKDLFRYVR